MRVTCSAVSGNFEANDGWPPMSFRLFFAAAVHHFQIPQRLLYREITKFPIFQESPLVHED